MKGERKEWYNVCAGEECGRIHREECCVMRERKDDEVC